MSSPSTVPPELKPITPYLSRANELSKADPVISYWCTYFALQQAMTLGTQSTESQQFLFSLMDKLEAMKSEHSDNDAVTDDLAASSYIENFGYKIFTTADNEDRRGTITRATAKKFLAAANFLELLSVFGTISVENREKIKYSKWKATDIAKAFREGREPTRGPAGGLGTNESQEGEGVEGGENDPVVEANTVRKEEEKELEGELEELGKRDELENSSKASNSSVKSPSEVQGGGEEDYQFPQHPTTTLPTSSSTSSTTTNTTPIPSAPDFVVNDEDQEEEENPSRINTPSLPDFIDSNESSSQPPPSTTLENPQSHQSFILDSTTHLPSAPSSHQTSDLPNPGVHDVSEPPAFPSVVFPPPAATSISPPSSTSLYSAPPPPALPSNLPKPQPQSQSQPQQDFNNNNNNNNSNSDLKERDKFRDPLEVATIQKHAKWAISALNYEDYETARKELREALRLLE